MTTAVDSTVAARTVGLSKVYGGGDTRVVALDAVSVSFGRGEFTAIMGPSGSGKSTLMHCAAGLDTASAGTVHIGDVELTGLNDKALTRLRRDKIGFIFQSFNLLPTLTALENITLPMDIAGRKPDKA
ncbi:ABC transporter ATP-binding protein, partial [Motilibacter aurantiacus]|uniref:ABC transporter ATP-binding protein n=1 Tax=Motilibacter aurantiacus TaxID=2714955 RepID=UPI002F2B3375